MIKKCIKPILLLFGVFCLMISISCNQEKTTVDFSSQEIKELDSFLLNVHQVLPVPGLAIAIIKDNKIYHGTIGKTELPNGNGLTDSTVFFTGNLSEPMVATGIMKLVQEGKINLDDPVVKHLPYFRLGDNSYVNITIRHLLTHTSGVPYHSAAWDLPYYGDDALARTTKSVHLQPPLFKPAGSRIKRTPFNFDILADLISKVSKVSFEEYMRESVFKPLSMNNSAYHKKDIATGRLAQPHKVINWLDYSIERDTSYPYNREHAGSIGLHASVKDMSSWMYMLLNEGKISEANFVDKKVSKELTSLQFKSKNSGGMGLGWEILQKGNDQIFNKSHQLGGFGADIQLIPEKHIGVLVLSNISEDFDPRIIGDKIIEWLNGKDFVPIKQPIHIPMGKTLARTGSLDSALYLYSDLFKKAPNQYDFSEEALSQLGVNLFYRLDRKADAIRVYEFCVAKNPNSAYAYLNLAEAYSLQKDIPKAKEALTRVRHLPINNPEMLPRLDYVEEMLKGRP